MSAVKSQSPLDSGQAKQFVTKALESGRKPSEVVHGLEVSYGIRTTTDSIRRFKERHGIKMPTSNSTVKSEQRRRDSKAASHARRAKPKSRLQISIIKAEDEECITAFIPGRKPLVATNRSHPNFEEIKRKAKTKDESILDLLNVPETVAERFQKLSDRVTAENGKLYLDGDEMHDGLTDQILRFLREGKEKNWNALVLFYENLLANPNEHSRQQLYGWLARLKGGFAITQLGNLVAYKAVNQDYCSKGTGPARVDGVAMNGHIPNKVGSEITMPRSDVNFDPTLGCSDGLHLGTWSYARGFIQNGIYLVCIVNPRDVVSVPTECNEEKMRVCAYKVGKIATGPEKDAVVVL